MGVKNKILSFRFNYSGIISVLLFIFASGLVIGSTQNQLQQKWVNGIVSYTILNPHYAATSNREVQLDWIAGIDNSEENESEEDLCHEQQEGDLLNLFLGTFMFTREKSALIHLQLTIHNRIPHRLFVLHHSWKSHLI